ncbi:MAG: hypothetical protein IKY87_04990 [Paludibacteraceae bacterium]|nr:hypothetical protein [Paludibacteraceae bacterium]
MKFVIRYTIFFICLIAFLEACTSDTTCRKDMTVCAIMTLQADSLNAQGHSVKYTAWDSISVQAIDNETYILYNNKNIKQIPLFLRPDTTITAFLMTFHNQTDTLFVEHTPRQYFVSLACGCAVYHTIHAAWSTDCRVDSIHIVNANVENAVQENLCLYLHE